MKLLITFFFLFSSITVLAQINTEASIEIPLKSPQQFCVALVLPQKEFLVIIDEKNDAPSMPKTVIIKYDSLLREVWKQTYTVRLWNIVNLPNSISRNNIYFYLNQSDSLYRVISIDLTNGKAVQINSKDLLGKTSGYERFFALPNGFLFVKRKEGSNTIFYCDTIGQQAKVLSNTNFIKAKFAEIKADEASGVFSVILYRKEHFYFYLYDSQGNRLFTHKVNRKDDKHKFISHNSYIKNADEQFVIGLYGKSMFKPQGVYVSKFLKTQYTGTTFYPFHQFANFHNHLSSKKREKIEAQIKKQGGYVYGYFFSAQNLKEIDNKLLYTIGMYQERNDSKNTYKHTIICAFDKSGQLLWDNALNYKALQDIKLYKGSINKSLIFTGIGLQKDSLSALNLTGEKLYFSKTQTNIPFLNTLAPQKNLPAKLPYGASHWYDNYFLLLEIVNREGKAVFKIVKIK